MEFPYYLHYKFHENYSLKNLTTIGVGGKADYVAYPLNLHEFIKLIKFARNNEIKFIILGNGSNVLFSDNRFKGIIISILYISKSQAFHPQIVFCILLYSVCISSIYNIPRI